MRELWVANASPVIILAKVGHLHLLEQLAGEVVLPEPVVAEILAGPVTDPARQAVESGWGVRVPGRQPPPELLEWGLGPGETAVLAVALAMEGCTAVVDDAAARMCARAVGVPVIGTLGVVLRARKRRLVPSAAALLQALAAAGLYLEEAVMRSALERIGEK